MSNFLSKITPPYSTHVCLLVFILVFLLLLTGKVGGLCASVCFVFVFVFMLLLTGKVGGLCASVCLSLYLCVCYSSQGKWGVCVPLFVCVCICVSVNPRAHTDCISNQILPLLSKHSQKIRFSTCIPILPLSFPSNPFLLLFFPSSHFPFLPTLSSYSTLLTTPSFYSPSHPFLLQYTLLPMLSYYSPSRPPTFLSFQPFPPTVLPFYPWTGRGGGREGENSIL